jgi:simple sugar transport system ATP-binding protein
VTETQDGTRDDNAGFSSTCERAFRPVNAPAAASESTPRLELAGISKRYPGVQANDRVSLVVMPGEIHSVLGENGAGKSTLMKIIYGAVRPDQGEIRWNGARARITSPRHARELGIAMVFQHFALFETLTVAENVRLGVGRRLGRAEVAVRLQRVVEEYDLDIAPDRPVASLAIGERQRVEIARALVTDPRLLILDEPTAVLAPTAVERLFQTLRKLAASGCAVLYISHKLDEVRALCHRSTVLRAGRVTGVVDPRAETNHTLSEMMLGSAPPAPARREKRAGEIALEARKLRLPRRDRFGVPLHDVQLTVRAGEVLGIAGVSGNGQAELLEALSGEQTDAPAGSVRLMGVDVASSPPRPRRAQGLCYVPEERVGRATVAALSLSANTVLTRREPVARGGWLRRGVARSLASRLIDLFSVKAGSPASAAGSLSGGNLQKFIVGREVDAGPRILIVAQPTWGLDVGAAALIRRALLDLAASGCAVLVVSEDLEELFEICDELVVIARGRLSPRMKIAEATMAQIGQYMSGLFPGGADGDGGGDNMTAEAHA